MITVPVFDDAELLLIGHMERMWQADQNKQMWVSTDIPNPRPDEFVRVLLVGGVQANRITDNPTISLEGWAVTPERAVDIIRRSRAYFHALENQMLGAVQVGAVQSSSPVELPYPDVDQFRYTCTGNLHLSYSSIIEIQELP